MCENGKYSDAFCQVSNSFKKDSLYECHTCITNSAVMWLAEKKFSPNLSYSMK